MANADRLAQSWQDAHAREDPAALQRAIDSIDALITQNDLTARETWIKFMLQFRAKPQDWPLPTDEADEIIATGGGLISHFLKTYYNVPPEDLLGVDLPETARRSWSRFSDQPPPEPGVYRKRNGEWERKVGDQWHPYQPARAPEDLSPGAYAQDADGTWRPARLPEEFWSPDHRPSTRTGPGANTPIPTELLAPPLDPSRYVDDNGKPQTRREYTKDQFISMWEKMAGREMTLVEKMTAETGCVGVVNLLLGHQGSHPPTNLAFGDPHSHGVRAELEKVLAPGQIADKEAKRWEREFQQAGAAVQERGMNWKAVDGSGTTRTGAEHYYYCLTRLLAARSNAQEAWSSISQASKREMLENRRDARIDADRRVLDRVSGYRQRFNDILAVRPAGISEFLRLVKADPDLGQLDLKGLENNLPTGDPSEWKVVIFSKHFWSGQSERDGGTAVDHLRIHRGLEAPDPDRFKPHAVTGQVDMSGDLNQCKPGHVAFDYGFYDEKSGDWWHANHADSDDPTNPQLIYQSTSERFFASQNDFDSSVICIAFVRQSYSRELNS
jgi:hypothetical protein